MCRTSISIAASATVCTVLCIMLLLALAHHTTPPRTYRAAVMQILDQRGLPYADVEVTNACTIDRRDCAYLPSYTTYVTVSAGEPVHGRIVCKRQIADGPRDACTLSLATLALHNLPLPPLAHDPAWLSTLKDQLDRIATWLRTWLPRR
jgi:hypothetical protein